MTLPYNTSATIIDTNDEYSIPIDIGDIISICKDFSLLGWQVRNQIESILEHGVDSAIKSGYVKPESLSRIKYFLHRICECVYFGDAVLQAQDCLRLIQQYEDIHPLKLTSN